MRQFRLLFAVLALMATTAVMAQQNVQFRQGNLSSPQVNADHSVTFRLQAPKASEVTVIGDWEADGGRLTMQRNAEGVWECTSKILPSEMYTYRFNIDGVTNLDPLNPFSRRDVGNLFSVFFVGDGVADYYQVRDVKHGTVQTTWYTSKVAGAERRLSVYLPAQYATNANESYPVLYLLHGSGGDETAWLELGNVAHIMDNMIAEGKVQPMIVVMPNGNIAKTAAPGETSENQAYKPMMSNQIPGNYKNGKYETNFNEIIQFVDKNYRTKPEKQYRALAGLSMGGFHTLYTSLNNKNTFDYIGLFSAGLNMTGIDTTLPAYSDLNKKLLEQKNDGFKLYWIAIGTDDFLYQANLDFMKRLDDLKFPYEYRQSTRGHIWSNWRQYLVEFTPKLFK